MPAHPLASSSAINATVNKSSPAPPYSFGTDNCVIPEDFKISRSSSSITPLLSICNARGTISFCTISFVRRINSCCFCVIEKSMFPSIQIPKFPFYYSRNTTAIHLLIITTISFHYIISLFIAQCIYRVQLRRPSRRIKPEYDTGCYRKHKCSYN